jgi:hypothetical protein
VGWFLWIISAIFPFISEITENQLISESLLILYSILILTGLLFIIYAVISYFQQISNIGIIGSSLFIILISFSLFFLFGLDFASNFTFILFFILAIIVLIRRLGEWRNMRNVLGESLKWFYCSVGFGSLYLIYVLLTTLLGYSFSLYFSDNLPATIIHFFFAIGITIFLAVLTIHLEHSLSNNLKFQLKDRYSHDLGNIMQIILNTIETFLPSDDPQSVQLIKKKCTEAGNLITEIREL